MPGMSDAVLTTVFGVLATLLAIASVLLAYAQYRTRQRQRASDATPSTLENGQLQAPSTSSNLREMIQRPDAANLLPTLIQMYWLQIL